MKEKIKEINQLYKTVSDLAIKAIIHGAREILKADVWK